MDMNNTTAAITTACLFTLISTDINNTTAAITTASLFTLISTDINNTTAVITADTLNLCCLIAQHVVNLITSEKPIPLIFHIGFYNFLAIFKIT